MQEGVMSTKSVKNSGIDVSRRNILLGGTTLAAASAIGSTAPVQTAMAQQPRPRTAASVGKPNILVIWGDDIGIANISAYSNGLMGYETPNIDRIAREGLKLQHYYGEQSGTAGRSAFPSGPPGCRSRVDPSIGGLPRTRGYASGRFGENHVGEPSPSLPAVNGFDK